ncbi:MAG TPA: 4'-phosphopantetheinyl transferase superfamily protein [Chryseolinea sp.]|nr:4'-phosphopantetheinyl transferase superfamily protein [Chryseolinea sp.]
MPLEKLVVELGRTWALWRIEEEEETLAEMVSSLEELSDTVTSPQKRLEWLAGRVLVKEVMEAMDLNFQGIVKDDFGKPYPVGYDYQISLSHSFPFVAVLLDKYESVGIDLEQPKEKLLRIASRIHHVDEVKDAGTDIIKHCIYWCAKETLIKIYGKKDLIFSENMRILPFQRQMEGNIIGKIIVKDMERVIPLYYKVYPEFVLVFNKRME